MTRDAFGRSSTSNLESCTLANILQSSSNNENDTKMVFLKEFERHLAQPSRDTSRPLYCCRLILSNGWPFSKTKVTWLKHVLAI